MVAHCCQSKQIKITKTKKENKKNESEKIEKMKKIFRKKPTKLSWPMSAKSDKKNFLFKKKEKHKIMMAHECQI